MNLEIYSDSIREKGTTLIRGKVERFVTYQDMLKHESPIIQEFLKDDDIQEISVCSTNLGIALTYTKVYRSASKPNNPELPKT